MPIVRRLDPRVESILVVKTVQEEQECFADEKVVPDTGGQDCYIAAAVAVAVAGHIAVEGVRRSCHTVAECLGYCIDLAAVDTVDTALVVGIVVDVDVAVAAVVDRNRHTLQDCTPRISDELATTREGHEFTVPLE
jgi:hypothetical protein